MSTHYSKRNSSGCCGCAVAMAVALGVLGIATYVCFEFANFIIKQASNG